MNYFNTPDGVSTDVASKLPPAALMFIYGSFEKVRDKACWKNPGWILRGYEVEPIGGRPNGSTGDFFIESDFEPDGGRPRLSSDTLVGQHDHILDRWVTYYQHQTFEPPPRTGITWPESIGGAPLIGDSILLMPSHFGHWSLFAITPSEAASREFPKYALQFQRLSNAIQLLKKAERALGIGQ